MKQSRTGHWKELDDPDLVASARLEPVRPAFRALYERYERELFRFLLRLVRDRVLAEDVLQETFLLVHQNLHRYDAQRPFRPWLYRIARNAGLNALRKQRKLEPLEAAETAASQPETVPAEAARREGNVDTRAALEDLPDDVRALLIQRHALGMKLEELAESWSCTERTIRNRLQRAGMQLAEAIVARRGEGDTA